MFGRAFSGPIQKPEADPGIAIVPCEALSKGSLPEMRKNQLPSWSVEMHNWLAEKRSLFRVVTPGISVCRDSGDGPLVYRWFWIEDHPKNYLFFKYLYGIFHLRAC
jgi:hypothetical protein